MCDYDRFSSVLNMLEILTGPPLNHDVRLADCKPFIRESTTYQAYQYHHIS